MLIRDSEDRVFKTGLKIDWNPKMCVLNKEKIEGGIKQMTCGKNHYTLLDNNNQLHVFGGTKILKEKVEEEYDGFGIYNGNDLFDDGQVLDLQMKYETFGALVKNA